MNKEKILTTQAYQTAQTSSYGSKKTNFQIWYNSLRRIHMAGAPLGIAASVDKDGRNILARAMYWQPRVDMMTETARGEGEFEITHIFGVDFHGWNGQRPKSSVRIFPPKPKPMFADMQRAQTVTFGPNGTLFVTRNADGVVFQLFPPSETNSRWSLNKKFKLTDKLIHATYYDSERSYLYTIESKLDQMNNGEWDVVAYKFNGAKFQKGKFIMTVPYQTYGVTRRPRDNELWFGADIRGPRPGGIYRYDKLVIDFPGIGINGLCFLPNGSAFATFYGESSTGITAADGSPSEFIHIPADMFRGK